MARRRGGTTGTTATPQTSRLSGCLQIAASKTGRILIGVVIMVGFFYLLYHAGYLVNTITLLAVAGVVVVAIFLFGSGQKLRYEAAQEAEKAAVLQEILKSSGLILLAIFGSIILWYSILPHKLVEATVYALITAGLVIFPQTRQHIWNLGFAIAVLTAAFLVGTFQLPMVAAALIAGMVFLLVQLLVKDEDKNAALAVILVMVLMLVYLFVYPQAAVLYNWASLEVASLMGNEVPREANTQCVPLCDKTELPVKGDGFAIELPEWGTVQDSLVGNVDWRMIIGLILGIGFLVLIGNKFGDKVSLIVGNALFMSVPVLMVMLGGAVWFLRTEPQILTFLNNRFGFPMPEAVINILCGMLVVSGLIGVIAVHKRIFTPPPPAPPGPPPDVLPPANGNAAQAENN